MDFGVLLDDDIFTDIELVLHDENNEIIINLHKNILYTGCNYFKKLFTTFAKDGILTHHRIEVPNAFVVYDIIMSFYGRTTNIGGLDNWRWLLECARCYDFFGMAFDKSKLVDLVVPVDGFDLLLKVVDILGYEKDALALVIANMPNEYDLTSLNNTLVKKMLDYHDNNHDNSNIVVSGDRDGIKIWDIASGEMLKKFKSGGLFDDVLNTSCMTLMHNNKKLLHPCPGLDKNIKVMDIASEKITSTEIFMDLGHYDIICICTTHDNKKIVCMDSRRDIYVWDLISSKLVYEIDNDTIGKGHASMCISPNDDKIIVADVCYVKIWELSSGNLLRQIKNKCNYICVSSDNKIIAASNDKVKIFDGTSYELINTIHKKNIVNIHVTHDNKKIVIEHIDNIYSRYGSDISAHDITNGNLLKYTITSHYNICVGKTRLSPYGDKIVCSTKNGIVLILDLMTGDLINEFTVKESSTVDICVSNYNFGLFDRLKKLNKQ